MKDIISDIAYSQDRLPLFYRRNVKRAKNLSSRLSNPINRRTGKPLSPSTVKQYRTELNALEPKLAFEKQALATLARCRMIGPKSDEKCPPNALFLRSIVERLAETYNRNVARNETTNSFNNRIATLKKERDWYKKRADFWYGRVVWLSKRLGLEPEDLDGEHESTAQKKPRGQLVVMDGGRRTPKGPFSQPRQ